MLLYVRTYIGKYVHVVYNLWKYAKIIAYMLLRCEYTTQFTYYMWESAFNIIGTAKVSDVCKYRYMYVVYNRLLRAI